MTEPKICSENRWNPVGCSRMGPCGNDWPTSPQLSSICFGHLFHPEASMAAGQKTKPPSVNRQLSSALIHVLKPPIGSLRWCFRNSESSCKISKIILSFFVGNPLGLFGVGCTVTPRHWFYWYIFDWILGVCCVVCVLVSAYALWRFAEFGERHKPK